MSGRKTILASGVGVKPLVALVALCAPFVLADFLVEHHAHFGVDGTPGFAAWYAPLACFALVLIAKVAGALLKRGDDYYD